MRVNTEVLAEKLRSLNTTQQMIESVSQWCIFYRRDASTIVHYWDVEFRRSAPDKKLSLLYLTNDILQNSRKKGREFADEFVRVVPKALKQLYNEGDEKINRSLVRLVGVWEERRVFAKKSFRSCLTKTVDIDVPVLVDEKPATPSVTVAKYDKYAPVERLAEAIEETEACVAKTREMEQKASMPEGLVESGGIRELQDCEAAMGAYYDTLNAEVEKRRKIVALLQDLKTKAEDDLENCQEQLMLAEIRKKRISSRIGDLEASNSPPAPEVDSWEDEPMPDPMTGLEGAGIPITPPPVNTPESAVPQLGAQELAALMATPGVPTSTAPQDDDAPAEPGALPVTSGGGSGGGTLDMVAKGLAESDQPAALLAQALQELPEEDREQFGFNIADLLNQPYNDDQDEPPQW
ncbi:hypothetical protein BSKO_02013 [Bryopsis sp. KO-2023]|nr:hypothetical protein BSKO_02013 [Bryopsis sp. KO-2023]